MALFILLYVLSRLSIKMQQNGSDQCLKDILNVLVRMEQDRQTRPLGGSQRTVSES